VSPASPQVSEPIDLINGIKHLHAEWTPVSPTAA
jgi:hypothetical protein